MAINIYLARKGILICLFFICFQSVGQKWESDKGNGTFQNPVLHADYSDPDVIRVGEDFYMVSSSFNCMPGIPVLHSKDLINWKIINHVYDRLPFEKYDKPIHGEGSWAPSIRFHQGKYYVYFCTPKEGLFLATTENPTSKWELTHVTDVVNWEDPCPFWDADGKAYLVRSKLCGGILFLHKLSTDGKKLLDNGTVIFNDQKNQPTIEGPKFLKKDGYYYILAPAGSVTTGWQTVLRSKNIYGPYEQKIVLEKGSTSINGPHQGGLVDLSSGGWWFLHFQDRDAYGRIPHLQPVTWKDGWPEMGKDLDGNGIGEPVSESQKPNVSKKDPIETPATSDDFTDSKLGLQWQWAANPQTSWYSFKAQPGKLRLFANQVISENGNPWYAPNLLLQKFPAPQFSATTSLSFSSKNIGDKAGLIVMGESFSYICLTKTINGYSISQQNGDNKVCDGSPKIIAEIPTENSTIFLKVQVGNEAKCSFAYSFDEKEFKSLGNEFIAKKGKWIGAKVGIFSINPNMPKSTGYADFDWFRIE